MARQESINPIIGTIGNLNYYKQEGEYRVRKKPGVTTERLKKDKVFERSRASAGRFGVAARLVHDIYYTLPKQKKSRQLYNSLVGEAIRMINAGKEAVEIIQIIRSLIVHTCSLPTAECLANAPSH